MQTLCRSVGWWLLRINVYSTNDTYSYLWLTIASNTSRSKHRLSDHLPGRGAFRFEKNHIVHCDITLPTILAYETRLDYHVGPLAVRLVDSCKDHKPDADQRGV